MKLVKYKLINGGLIIMLLLPILSMVNIVGCTPAAEQPTTRIRIIPLSNQEVVALSPKDIVQIMRRVGFSDEQIVRHGAELRNGLSQSGAAQLRIGSSHKVEATFAVHGNCVYISTRLRGSFIYNVKTGWVG